MNKTSLTFSLAAVMLIALPLAALAQTWTPPTAAPPNGNTPAPVNVGANGQTKTGDLFLTKQTGTAFGVPFGDIFFGFFNSGLGANFPVDLNLYGNFKYTPEGTALSPIVPGYVLTRDATGNANWTDPSTIIGGGGGGPEVDPRLPAGTAQGQTLYWDQATTAWKVAPRTFSTVDSNKAFFVHGTLGDVRTDNWGLTYLDYLGVNKVTNLSGDIFVGDGVGLNDTIRIGTNTATTSVSILPGMAPTAGQVLKAVDATGKVTWANETGGGGGGSTMIQVFDNGVGISTGADKLKFDSGDDDWFNVYADGANAVSIDIQPPAGFGTTLFPGTEGQTLVYNGTTNMWQATNQLKHFNTSNSDPADDITRISGNTTEINSTAKFNVNSNTINFQNPLLNPGQGRFWFSKSPGGSGTWSQTLVHQQASIGPSAFTETIKLTDQFTDGDIHMPVLANEGMTYLKGDAFLDGGTYIGYPPAIGSALYIPSITTTDSDGLVKLCIDTDGLLPGADPDDWKVVKCKADPGSVVVSGTGSVVSSGTGSSSVVSCTGEAVGGDGRRSKFCNIVIPDDVSSITVKLLSAGGGGGGGGAGWEAGNESGGGGGGGGGGGAASQYTVAVTPGDTIYMMIGLGGNGGTMGGRYGNSGSTYHDAGDGTPGGDTYITSSNAVSLSSAPFAGTSKVLGGQPGQGGEAGETILIPNGMGGFDHQGQPGGIGGTGALGNISSGSNGSDGGFGMADDAGVTGGFGGDAGILTGGPGGTNAFVQNDIDGDGLDSSDPNTRFFGVRGKTGQTANASSLILAGGGSGGGGGEGVSLGTYIFGSTGVQGLNVNPPGNWGSLGQIALNYCRRNAGDDQKSCGGRGGSGGNGAIEISW